MCFCFVWFLGSFSWVLSVWSVFWEGDLVMCLRVEKCCEIRDKRRELGCCYFFVVLCVC